MKSEGEKLLDEVLALRKENAALLLSVADHGEQLKQAREGREKAQNQLEWLRLTCRIVFYPAPPAYPIEHAPHAGKDQWDALMAPATNGSYFNNDGDKAPMFSAADRAEAHSAKQFKELS